MPSKAQWQAAFHKYLSGHRDYWKSGHISHKNARQQKFKEWNEKIILTVYTEYKDSGLHTCGALCGSISIDFFYIFLYDSSRRDIYSAARAQHTKAQQFAYYLQ